MTAIRASTSAAPTAGVTPSLPVRHQSTRHSGARFRQPQRHACQRRGDRPPAPRADPRGGGTAGVPGARRDWRRPNQAGQHRICGGNNSAAPGDDQPGTGTPKARVRPAGPPCRRPERAPPTRRCAIGVADRGEVIDALLQQSGRRRRAPPEIRGHELVEKLGDGGQGVVYLARHQPSGDLVAVKMLLAKVAVKERARECSNARSPASAALDHPNVVSFREAGRVGVGMVFHQRVLRRRQRRRLGRPRRSASAGPGGSDRSCRRSAGLAHAHTAPLPTDRSGWSTGTSNRAISCWPAGPRSGCQDRRFRAGQGVRPGRSCRE